MTGRTINPSTPIDRVHRLTERVGRECGALLSAEERLAIIPPPKLFDVQTNLPVKPIVHKDVAGVFAFGLCGI